MTAKTHKTTQIIRIADLEAELRLPRPTVEELAQRWAPYFAEGTTPTAVFDVEQLPGKPALIESYSAPRLLMTFDELWISQEGLFDLRLDLVTRRGRIRYRRLHQDDLLRRGPAGLRAALVGWVAAFLPQREGLLLHASGIKLHGKGVAFVGKSGAGKSTICSMFPADQSFNDELVAITDISEQPRIHSTPFVGDLNQIPKRHNAPFVLALALRKSRENLLTVLSGPEALRLFLRCVALSEGAPSLERRVVDLVIALLDRVCVRRFDFAMQPEAVRQGVTQALVGAPYSDRSVARP